MDPPSRPLTRSTCRCFPRVRGDGPVGAVETTNAVPCFPLRWVWAPAVEHRAAGQGVLPACTRGWTRVTDRRDIAGRVLPVYVETDGPIPADAEMGRVLVLPVHAGMDRS